MYTLLLILSGVCVCSLLSVRYDAIEMTAIVVVVVVVVVIIIIINAGFGTLEIQLSSSSLLLSDY